MSLTDKLKNMLGPKSSSSTDTASSQASANNTLTLAGPGVSSWTHNVAIPGIMPGTMTGNSGSVTVTSGYTASGGIAGGIFHSLGAAALTADEHKEMEELKKEHKQQVKFAKLDVFKGLQQDLRQQIINGYVWQATIGIMNSTTIIKNPKLEELEKKNDYGKLFTTSGTSFTHTAGFTVSSNGYFMSMPSLPEDISVEDLQQAHMEAVLEEEMLDGGKT